MTIQDGTNHLERPWKISDELFAQACKDLEARRLNYGSWAGGKIPDSIATIMQIYNSDTCSVAESVIGAMAIARISKND